MKKSRYYLILLIINTILSTSHAGLGGVLADPDIEKDNEGFRFAPWEEGRSPIPAVPAEDQFSRLGISEIEPEFEVFIALGSLTVSQMDSVLRFWLGLKAQSGHETLIYTGVRCSEGTYKQIGFGYRNRVPSIRRNKYSEWKDAGLPRQGHYMGALVKRDVCDGELPRKPSQILSASPDY